MYTNVHQQNNSPTPSNRTLIYEEYVAEGLLVEAVVDEALYAKLAKYECE